jgi:dipeptidyl aminopeptidase/acylaminoacyl peptidase
MLTTRRTWRRRLPVAAIVLLVAGETSAQSTAPARLSLDDLRHMAALRSPAISPDGKRVAMIVSRPDFERNLNVAELVVVDLASGESVVSMRGRAGLRDPAWIGNGRIAYVARADSGGAMVQIFSRNAGDSAATEVQLTRATTVIRTFAVSPDASAIAYVSDDPAPVRTGEERHNDSFEVGNDDYLTMAPPHPAHLWVQPIGGGAARRLTSGGWSLSTSLATTNLSWSPDGRSIVAQRFLSPHAGDTDKSRVVVVDVSSGSMRLLADAGAAQSQPSVSPDGQWVVFRSPRDGVPANQRDVMLVGRDGGTVRNLTRALDRAVSPQWLPNGDLLLAGTDGTRMSLWRLPLAGQPTRLALGAVVSFSGASVADDGTIAFIGSERAHPDELYVLGPSSGSPRRVTGHHHLIAARALGRTEGLEWRTRDALTADGVVTYPPEFDPARRYPLVLYIHGGPTASSTEGFLTRAQLFAAKGWIVFQPNYRGSDNRGNAFQRAIADDPGPGIDADVMSGIAALVRRGGVDTTRIAVSGWSFGGYVSAWLIGHHRRWKAAVVGAGAMDLFDMYTLTDLNVQLRHAITASPYLNGRERWFREQSPLTYASRVRTPTLILHDVRDQRVTITQSYKLFHALKDNGVPVQFIAYPVAGHSPTDPVRARDVTRRWIDWLDRWLTSPTP